MNGVVEDYRITVIHNGEPNRRIDTSAFDSESYDAAGTVQRGNVQVHERELAAP